MVVYEHWIYVGVSNKVFTYKCQRIGDCMEFFMACICLSCGERVFDVKGANLSSIIKTYGKKFIWDDDNVFYKLCKQSWCEENYIVVYHDV